MFFDETKYKLCKRCDIVKPLTEYYKSKSTTLGTLLFCKKCYLKSRKKYYIDNKCNDTERAKQREWCRQYRARKNSKMLSV